MALFKWKKESSHAKPCLLHGKKRGGSSLTLQQPGAQEEPLLRFPRRPPDLRRASILELFSGWSSAVSARPALRTWNPATLGGAGLDPPRRPVLAPSARPSPRASCRAIIRATAARARPPPRAPQPAFPGKNVRVRARARVRRRRRALWSGDRVVNQIK